MTYSPVSIANSEQPGSLDDYDGLRLHDNEIQPEQRVCSGRETTPYAGSPCSDFFLVKCTNKKRGISGKLSMKVLRGPFHEAERVTKELIKTLKPWSRLKHDNIVPLYGICGPNIRVYPGIVVPHYENGNVIQFLRKNSDFAVTTLLVDIMSGLSYVHSLGIAHGELKGSNVFVDDDYRARISDFGLPIQLCDRILSSGNISGVYRWFAPEVIYSGDDEDGEFVVKPHSDIYSFAMTALEMYTLAQPFSDIRNHSVVLLGVVNNNRRPNKPTLTEAPQLTDEMWNLITDCWDQEACRRPTTEVVGQRVYGLHLMQQY